MQLSCKLTEVNRKQPSSHILSTLFFGKYSYFTLSVYALMSALPFTRTECCHFYLDCACSRLVSSCIDLIFVWLSFSPPTSPLFLLLFAILQGISPIKRGLARYAHRQLAYAHAGSWLLSHAPFPMLVTASVNLHQDPLCIPVWVLDPHRDRAYTA